MKKCDIHIYKHLKRLVEREAWRAMRRGESPLMAVRPLVMRFESRVQAKHRVALYDYSCKARKCAELRYPHMRGKERVKERES